MRILFFILLIASPPLLQGGNPAETFKTLSFPEKCWVLFHIRHAKAVHTISMECKTYAEKHRGTPPLDSLPAEGTADAFRHAYWMARLAQRYNKRLCISLGKAHERGNKIQFRKNKHEDGILPDFANTQMDLWNNLAGIKVGQQFPAATGDELRDIIFEQIKTGKLAIIEKTPTGEYVLTNGTTAPQADLPQKWKNGKTIVASFFTIDK